MTKALEAAFREASQLPEDEQDALADAIRSEIRSDDDWLQAFSQSQDVLEGLADEALADHRSGRTKPLDTDKM